MQDLFFKQFILSIEEIDKFEQKEMKEIRPVKSTWYDWLIKYISGPIIKIVGGFKDKMVSLLKRSTPKNTKHQKLSDIKKEKMILKIFRFQRYLKIR